MQEKLKLTKTVKHPSAMQKLARSSYFKCSCKYGNTKMLILPWCWYHF